MCEVFIWFKSYRKKGVFGGGFIWILLDLIVGFRLLFWFYLRVIRLLVFVDLVGEEGYFGGF